MPLTKEENYELHFLKLALIDWNMEQPYIPFNFTDRGFCNYFQNKHHIIMGNVGFKNKFPTLYSLRTTVNNDVVFWYNRNERREALRKAINELEKKK